MTQLILPALIVICYAMVPAPWGVRAWVATGILTALGYASAAETPFQNQGPFDGLETAMLVWFMVLASSGVGARVFWALATARSLYPVPSITSMPYRADCMLAGGAGVAAGSIATLLVAVSMRGTTGGLTLHLVVAALAAAAAGAALRLPGRVRPLGVATGATLACLTLAGGTLYPGLILSRAEIIQPGAPRCIRTPDGSAPTVDQLRLLTLPLAQSRRPNLVLTVMTDRGQEDFRWSYRSFAFRTYDSYDGGPCPT